MRRFTVLRTLAVATALSGLAAQAALAQQQQAMESQTYGQPAGSSNPYAGPYDAPQPAVGD